MLRYEDVQVWCKVFGLIDNRVRCINQTLGCRYAVASGNPCRLLYESGRYYVTYYGSVLCRFGVYDVPGADAAFSVVDALSDSVWSLRRGAA